MKRISRLFVSVVLLLASVSVSFSQEASPKKAKIFHLGVKGGIDFSSLTYNKPNAISENMNSFTGFNAGVAFSIKLPVKGMTIQPELNYVLKGSLIRGTNIADQSQDKVRNKMGYIELPVNLQYGLDLIFLRPFIMVSPYIGYSVYQVWESDSGSVDFNWNNINRFEYGIGVGGGIDLWRFQLQIRYNWNLGPFISSVPEGIIDTTSGYIIDSIGNGNFRGLDVSVTFFF